MSRAFFRAGLALALLTPVRLRSQNLDDSTTDGAAQRALAADLRTALSTWVYWRDTRAESAVRDCQIRYRSFCAADHYAPLQFGTARPKDWPEQVIPQGELRRLLERGTEEPGDNGWYVGQLTLLLLTAGNLDSALAVVRECRGAEWWCLALQGFAQHAGWRFPQADTLFTRALAAMPRDRRCAWEDISLLLGSPAREAYTALDCDARRGVEDRLWWLADPLYLVAGNERRAEHFSRRVLDSLFTGALSPFGTTWDADLSDMLIRYGLPTHWIVDPDWAHMGTPAYHFLPDGALPGETIDMTPDRWSLAAPLDRVPERFRTPYGHVGELSHAQVAVFPRGDSMVVAAAIGLDEEPIFTAAPFIASITLSSGPGDLRTVARRGVLHPVSFGARAPRAPQLVSLEVMSHQWAVAGRTRFTIEPPAVATGPALSDLLFFVPRSTPPRDLDQAIPLMRGSDVVLRTQALGVFWEMYGFPQAQSASVTVAVTPIRTRAGLFTRLGRALHIADRPGALLVRFDEPAPVSGEGAGHAITVALESLTPGTYRLAVEVLTPDGSRAASEREITVVSRPPQTLTMEEALQQPVPRTGSYTPVPDILRRPDPIPPR